MLLKVYGGTAEQLKAYNVMVNPPQNNWVEVEDTVFFRQVCPALFSFVFRWCR